MMQGLKLLVLTHAAAVGDDMIAMAARRMSSIGLNVSKPRRLAGTAAEIPFEGDLPIGMLARDLTGGLPVDANIVPADATRRMLIADMDSTMISVECIDELADFAGLKDRVAAITERAMNGDLNFEEALVERVGLLKGLPEADLAACYGQRVKLNSGAGLLVRTMNARGHVTALVSGGFTYFSSRVARQAGFQIHQANRLLFADGRLTGEVARPILGRSAKVELLRAISADKGITPEQVIAVGDGANDISMIEAAGLGVAYHAKPTLKDFADATLDASDLTAILALQGIPETEWRA
jgi:phosphoserine phosphatase